MLAQDPTERAKTFAQYSRYLRLQCRAYDQADTFGRDSEQARFWCGVAMRQWRLAADLNRVWHFDGRGF